jgi:ubiquinone/menaquinone biosynthesis C-methylase UbiE
VQDRDAMTAELRSTEQIATIYTRLAAVYGAWTWMLERESLQRALTLAAIADGESVLEVAVGSGYVFREILRRNASGRTVGIDLTDAMLRHTRCKAERTGVPFVLQQGDARNLPFEDASFDLVLSNNMLGLLPHADAERAVREMVRVLRPGGRMVLVTMVLPRRRVPRWLYRWGAMRLGAWTEVAVESIVRACGIADVQRDVVTQLGFPSEVLCARKP